MDREAGVKRRRTDEPASSDSKIGADEPASDDDDISEQPTGKMRQEGQGAVAGASKVRRA